jgi:ATP adenylyltransferase
MPRIWAGWRMAYVSQTDVPKDSCVMCELQKGPDDEMLILARNEFCFAVMNAYPYTSGHLMVVPRRHEAELDGLTDDEANAIMAMTRQATVAMKAAYNPAGMNVGINIGKESGAGVPGHIHVHVLPRWGGDTNFMTSVAEARILPEALSASWARLRDVWPKG